jgi:hypothetical protein
LKEAEEPAELMVHENCNSFPLTRQPGSAGFLHTRVGAFAQDVSEKDKAKSLPPAILRKYDVDRDGLLSDSEKAAWKADVQRGRAEAQAKRLEKFDTNHDGKLDKGEKAQAAKPQSAKAASEKPSSN